VPVRVSSFCPFSLRVAATFVDTVLFPKIIRDENLRTQRGRVLPFKISIAEATNVISIKYYIFGCRTLKKKIGGEFRS
jgi:hypothetical protein